jgi:hypothetical protein
LNTYAIYYGWLTDDEQGEPNDVAHRIAAAGLPLVLAHFWTAAPERHKNISTKVLALMHAAETQVFAYMATKGGNARLRDVRKSITEYLAEGVDGIFFDEADSLRDDSKLDYYAALAQQVRGEGKTVILNPGVSRCGERIMAVADRVMVEHAWRDFGAYSPWTSRYDADRFMGVSSNEGHAMGYRVDGQRAIEDTRDAWRRGVGWHTSTDLYVKLPDWFDAYCQTVKQDTQE